MSLATKAFGLAFILSATDKMSRIVDQAVKKSSNSLNALERRNAQIAGAFVKTGAKMTGFGAAVGGAMYQAVKSTADYGEGVLKNSQRVGMGVEQWERMAYAARVSGVDSNQLADTLAKLGKRTADAAGGNKAYVQTFKDLGIQIKDSQGKLRAPNDVLTDLADVFSKVEDGAEKTALATELFGDTGTKLIPFLNKGREGLKELGDAGALAGLFLGDEGAQACGEFNEKLRTLGEGLTGARNQLGAAFMPALTRLVEKFTEVINKVAAWIKDNPKLAGTLGKIGLAVSGLLIGMGGLFTIIGTGMFVFGKFAKIIKGLGGVFMAAKNSMLLFRIQYAALTVWQKLATIGQWKFNAALLASPITWIVIGIMAVIAAAILLVKHWDKVSAFFTRLWDGIKKAFAAAWEWIKNLFAKYHPIGILINNWAGISDFFSGLAASAYEWGKEILSGLWEGIMSMVDKVVDGVKNIGKKIASGFKSFFGINSPSKLFAEYGVSLTQGLVVGMDRGGSEIEGATGSMAAHAVGGISQSMQSNTVMSGGNTGASVTYAPQITINGSMTAETRDEFGKMLRQHANDIISIIRRDAENAARLSFGM